MKEIENRSLSFKVEYRAGEGEQESRKISGYAAVFEQWSQITYWFKEKIARGAFDNANFEDCILCFNHDSSQLLARVSSGTLRYDIDDTGLHFEAELPNTTAGNDILELVKRGDITGCSFAFTIEEDQWTYKYGIDNSEELDERIITKIAAVYDVSPVVRPAYKEAQLDERSAKMLHEKKEEFLKNSRSEVSDEESERREREFQYLKLTDY